MGGLLQFQGSLGYVREAKICSYVRMVISDWIKDR